MKAAICTKYGTPDVIKIEERNKPTPKDKEILIRIITTSVQTGDLNMCDFINTAKKGNYNPILTLVMRFIMGYI